MNRSLANVILGGYGVSKGPAMEVEGTHTETDSSSVTEMLTGAKDVIIVPGTLLVIKAPMIHLAKQKCCSDTQHCPLSAIGITQLGLGVLGILQSTLLRGSHKLCDTFG